VRFDQAQLIARFEALKPAGTRSLRGSWRVIGQATAALSRATPRINLRTILVAVGLEPGDQLGLIEAHGTATPAGDAAELRTMINAFGGHGDPVGLGTVKSMIGHAMPAAGMAGLIKAALALHHATLPPTLHINEPHEASRAPGSSQCSPPAPGYRAPCGGQRVRLRRYQRPCRARGGP